MTAPLTPMQEAMLLDSLAFPAAGYHVEQLICETREILDPEKWRQAWLIAAGQHTALRTGFNIDTSGNAVQYVTDPADTPFTFSDRSNFAEPEQEEKWALFKDEDRTRGFQPGKAPWVRLHIVCLAPDKWRWMLTLHHALIDGWSLMLLLESWFDHYQGLTKGTTKPGHNSLPYFRFTNWLQQHLDHHPAAAEQFWKSHFEGYEQSPKQQEIRQYNNPDRQTINFTLTPELSLSLRDLATASGTTLNTLFMAGWALALANFHQNSEVITGFVRNCRRSLPPELQPVIGLVMNTLVIRISVTGSYTILEWLREIRRFMVDLRPFEQTPVRNIRNWVGARTSAFPDNIVVFEKYDVVTEFDRRFGDGGKRRFSLLERNNSPIVVTVAGEVYPQVRFIFDPEHYTENEAELLKRLLTNALSAICSNAGLPVNQLSILEPGEAGKLIMLGTGPVIPDPHSALLQDFLTDSFRKHSERTAIIDKTGGRTAETSYAAIDQRSRALAGELRRRGAGPDCLIAISLDRSAALVIAMLATLRSGAAILPIDPELPLYQRKKRIEQANPLVVITTRESATAADLTNVLLVDTPAFNNPETGETSYPPPRPENLAYAIYTSGSTGDPKLVGVEHRQVVNWLHYALDNILQKDDVRLVPFIDSIGSDASVSQIFSTLALGGTLVSLTSFFGIISSEYKDRFTCIGTTPSLLAALLQQVQLPPSIRFIGMGAEVIPASLIELVTSSPGVERIMNYYGPTETTIYSTVAAVWQRGRETANLSPETRGRNIGKPVANTRIYLFDRQNRFVPLGSRGEIFIAGEGVSRGYINVSEAGNNAFMTDPFDKTSRMYRTGDTGRWNPDGTLEFLGRSDDQVKLHGVRFTLGEVEVALGSCKGVERAVVVLKGSGNRSSRLVAFWLPSSDDYPSEEFLRQELRSKLSAAMVPTVLIRVSEFPLTPSGKIDRLALPIPETVETGNLQGYQPPRTLLEARLSSVWSEILETGPVGINDHFFNLGGDSLQALRVMAEAEKLAGHALHVNWLYQAPTIAQFARHLVEKRFAPVWGSLIILRDGSNKSPLFCVHGYGGNVPAYTRLMSALPADQPVYALQAPGRNDPGRSYVTLREMVSQDVKVILSAQPKGPYYLLGYSLGGMVAYELACQLRALGHQVAMLAVVDTLPSKMNLPPSVRITTTPYRIRYLVMKHLLLMQNMTPAKKIIHLGSCMAGIWFRITGKKKKAAFVPTASQVLHIPHYEDPDQYYVTLAANCEFTRYPGTIHLFEAGTVPLYLMKTWNHLASQGVVLHRISEIDHMGATESPDFVKKLCELLEEPSFS